MCARMEAQRVRKSISTFASRATKPTRFQHLGEKTCSLGPLQRGPSNPVNFSNLQYSLRARVTRCWSSTHFVRGVAVVQSWIC